MPFGVALLAENLNKPNMKWGVFYFGICLFGQYWTAIIQRGLVTIFKGDTSITWTEDFFLTGKSKAYRDKALLIFNGFPAVLGIILVTICILNAWIALAGYMFYIFTSMTPVASLNKMLPAMARMIKA
jgi:hypothetical protein